MRTVKAAAAGLLAFAAVSCAPTTQPMGPAVAEPRIAQDVLIAADGAALPLRKWLPDGAPKAVILALHGFNDYSRAFEKPGAWLAARGIATYAYDQRGFGNAPHPGIWAGTETLTADLRAAVAAVKARHPDVPLYLLGNSMGGAVVMATLGEAPMPAVRGAVLAAPAVWGRAHMSSFQTALLWVMARTLPWMTVTGRGLGRQASDNIPMLHRLGRDPLVIKETRVDAIEGLVDLMDTAFAAAPEIEAPPLLILYGAHDEIVPESPVIKAVRALPDGKGHRFAVYAGGWHMLLRDLRAEIVWGDIARWIEDGDAPLTAGVEEAAGRALAASN